MLGSLERPSDLVAHLTPNWFASVMGTGIVANAAATLPWQPTGLHTFATVVWLVAAAMLVLLCVGTAAHWRLHRERARGYADDPVMIQFYGAPPMAFLTVGVGTVLLGPDLLGTDLAMHLDVGLWTVGTLAGLVTAVVVPFLMITRHSRGDVVALPAWLMPVVPPMVAASAGALLVPYAPSGAVRLNLFLGCYALFGLTLLLGLLTLGAVYSRLLHDGLPALQAAPTVWIALGMIGQSVTAANLLGDEGDLVFTGSQASFATGLHTFGLAYGVITAGFGVMMFALASALTVHSVRAGMAFSLTWWSFTFPIGTCVTGLSALAATSGSGFLEGAAVVTYAVLLAAWATVAWNTLRRVPSGEVFLPA